MTKKEDAQGDVTRLGPPALPHHVATRELWRNVGRWVKAEQNKTGRPSPEICKPVGQAES